MQKVDAGRFGIRWGLLIGGVYLVFLFIRYYFGATNTILFGLMTLVSYAVVLVLLFFCGRNYRKENGGYAEMKELFKVLFIAVLIFEFVFASFTFVYLKFIDPQFFDKLRASTEALLVQARQPQSQIDKTLKDMDMLAQRSRTFTIFDFLKSYLYYVGITGLFALFYAFLLKKKPIGIQPGHFQDL